MDSSQPAPSGSVLPLFLRRKWKAENDASPTETTTKRSPQHQADYDDQYPQITRAERSRIIHRVFTAQEISERMEQMSKNVLVDIQKQIYRGEEAYYEETSGHGNLFRGWDAFADSKDAAPHAASMPQGTRRVPADCRWFASSCTSASRSSRPPSSLLKNHPSSRPSSALSSLLARPSNGAEPANVVVNEPKPAITETVPSTEIETERSPDLDVGSDVIKVEEAVEDCNTEVKQESKEEMYAQEPVEDDNDAELAISDSSIKRKRRDGDSSIEEDDDEPSKKKATTPAETDKDNSTAAENTQPQDDDTGKDEGKALPEEEDMDVEEEIDPSEKDDAAKIESNEDPTTPLSTESKSTPSTKEEKSKKEEPQKRRSSRNRKSS